MRSILLTILLAISSTIAFAQDIVILGEENEAEINAHAIKVVKYRDNFRFHCTYADVLAYLKEQAADNDANLVKITKHKYPDQWSTCHRVTAELYNVSNPHKYEKSLIWTTDRKVTWSDFKAKKSPFPEGMVQSYSYCELSFAAGSYSNFTKAKFTVIAEFMMEHSWVTDDTAEHTPEALQYQQLRFDLCEMYARKLYKELTETVISKYNYGKTHVIYKRIFEEFNDSQLLMDEETQFGSIPTKVDEWLTMVDQELTALSSYADHY